MCRNSGAFPPLPEFLLKHRAMANNDNRPDSDSEFQRGGTSNDEASTDGDGDNGASGSLSPSWAARVEELAREAVKASRSAPPQPSVLPFINFYRALRRNVLGPISPSSSHPSRPTTRTTRDPPWHRRSRSSS